jgi:hypothetical protein
MKKPALARTPRHFVRVKGGPHIDKVGHVYSSQLYKLALS